MKFIFFNSLKKAKRIVVGVIGGTILLIGILMIILPGPAMIFIPIGLSILGTEYLWAKRLLRKIKKTIASKNKDGNAAAKKIYSE
jgi:tellurite resistance protein TerC